jgi:hypothetical protein
MIYKEQLKRVKAKNPTDPRVTPLWDLIKDREGPAKSSRDRRTIKTARNTSQPRSKGATKKK